MEDLTVHIDRKFHIRWPFVLMIVLTALFLFWAIEFSVAPRVDVIYSDLFFTKSAVDRFAWRYHKLPGSLAELNGSVEGGKNLESADAGMSMQTDKDGIVVLKKGGYLAEFRVYRVAKGGRIIWTSGFAPVPMRFGKVGKGGRIAWDHRFGPAE
jgi:hypothetical protein